MATKRSGYIFLVDDEPMQQEMLQSYLSERFGYKFRTFGNGEDAIRELHLQPEVVVLDYHLNSNTQDAKNGIEILKDLRKLSPETQVIMLTGQDSMEIAVDIMKYGAFDYVIKSETAFSRTENILNNLETLRNLQESAKSYKRVMRMLIVAIVAIFIFSVFLVRKLDVSLPTELPH
jgi:two-component system, OmpR family, response regulator